MLETLRRFDCWLRNRPWPPKAFYTSDEVFDSLEEPRPWRTEAYWAVRRAYKRIVEFPSDLYYYTKHFVQRGSRGWADYDTWSLDWYLAGWLPAALRHLKEHKHGVPGTMFEDSELDENYSPTKEGMAAGVARWDAVMDKVIAGFEAWTRQNEGMYEEELGPYPMRRAGLSKEARKALLDERFRKVDELRKRDMRVFEEGMALFTKHFGSFWD